MNLGDTITIAGHTWTVRPFTAAEHARFDEFAAEHQLQHLAAKVEALRSAKGGGTAREALLKADAKRIQAKLNAYLDGDALKSDLGEDERLAAYTLAAELDAIQERIDALKREAAEAVLIAEEELIAARETVTAAFMHELLNAKAPLTEFVAALTGEDALVLDEVVSVGKLRAGLSARERRQAAHYLRTIRALTTPAGTGNASASPQPQPGAQGKPGKRGRSRKSSSKSKGGA